MVSLGMNMKLLLVLLTAVWLRAADTLDQLVLHVRNYGADRPVTMNDHCGFRYQIGLQQHLDELPAELQPAARAMLTPPTREKSVLSPSGHFRLHYDVSGVHAVPAEDLSQNGVPDYIDSAAVILDHVWQVEIDQLGFQPPPDENGQPVQTYNVYFSSMGYYGLTSFDLDDDISALPGQNYVSYLELHKNYAGSQFYTKGLDGLRVTAAHEFNHAIQIGYNFRWTQTSYGYTYPDLFFLEMTSTWMEDFVYDDINDYVQYVRRLIPDLDRVTLLTTDGNSEYANSLYLHMMDKLYQAGSIVSVWERIREEWAVDALNTVLQSHGSSFGKSYNRYASWLYFTGSRSMPDLYFPEGQLYPEFEPARSIEESGLSLSPWGMIHLLLTREGSSRFHPPLGFVKGTIKSAGGQGMINHIQPGNTMPEPAPASEGQAFVAGPIRPVVVVLTNHSQERMEEISYSLSPAEISPAPNPVTVHSAQDQVVFYNLPPGTKLTILTLAGQRVKTLGKSLQSGDRMAWDLRDYNNNRVASGIYLFLARSENFRSRGKFAVIRR